METPKAVTKVETKTASSNLASKSVGHKRAPSNSAPRTAAPNGKIEVLGVTISHANRLIFKDPRITKSELAKFYAAASQWILKDIAGHPVSLLRCPEGTSGDCFYQRNPGTGLGPDVKPFRWKHKGKSYEYLYIENEKGLIEFVQMGAIELHPWGAPVSHIDYPDRLIFEVPRATNQRTARLRYYSGRVR